MNYSDKTLVMLDGDTIDDLPRSVFESFGFNIIEFSGLYYDPTKLLKLDEVKPDYLFLWTTGIGQQWRKDAQQTLRRLFLTELQYTPKHVIFFNDDTAFAYQDIAERLKDTHGTKFYRMPFVHEDELTEINWI